MSNQPLMGNQPAPPGKVQYGGAGIPMGSPYGSAPAPGSADLSASEKSIADVPNIHIRRTLEGCVRLKLYYEAFAGKTDAGNPFMKATSVKEICAICPFVPLLCNLWHKGDAEWPLQVTSTTAGTQDGMITITESGMPVMVQGATEFKGRMRSSWWGLFCFPCGCGHEILGKTEGEIYSSLGPLCEACFEKYFFCFHCEDGYVKKLDEIYKYKPQGDVMNFGEPAFKVYSKTKCLLFFFPFLTICVHGLCKCVNEFEVQKVGKNFDESPFLLVAPVIGNTVH